MTQFPRLLEPTVFREVTQAREVSLKDVSFKSHIHLKRLESLSWHFTDWSIHIPVLTQEENPCAQTINNYQADSVHAKLVSALLSRHYVSTCASER